MEVTNEIIKAIPAWSEVRVRWRDAYCAPAGWVDVDDYEPKDSIATTLGRIWKDCQDNFLTLVGTVFESELPDPEQVGDVNHIPIVWILDIEVIKPYKETQ